MGETPRFFRYIRIAAVFTTAVSGILMKANKDIPEWLSWIESSSTLAVSISAAFMASLVVKDVTAEGSMPITKPEEINIKTETTGPETA